MRQKRMKRIRWILLCWAVVQMIWLPAAKALPTPRPAPIPTQTPEPTAEPEPALTAASPAAEAQKKGFPDPADFFGECRVFLTPQTKAQSLRIYSRGAGWVVALTRFLQAVETDGGSWSVHDLNGYGCYLITSKGVSLSLLPDWGEGILLIGDLDTLLAAGAVRAVTPVPEHRPGGQWVQVTHREKCEICEGTGKCRMCHGTGSYSLPGFEEYAVDCDPVCKYCENGYRTWTSHEFVTPAP